MAESRGIVVHHTTGRSLGHPDPDAWVRQIQAYHMDARGWSDIGYNFLVSDQGVIYEGRGWGVLGAHTKGHNSHWHGVAYLGDGTRTPPEPALGAILSLGEEHHQRYGRLEWRGHRDMAETYCPGEGLYAWLRSLHPPSQTPTPPPAPPPSARHAHATPLLRRGSRMAAVRDLQTHLRTLGYRDRDGRELVVDGIFGPRTEQAVLRFQAEHGLQTDGVVGPQTWAHLHALAT